MYLNTSRRDLLDAVGNLATGESTDVGGDTAARWAGRAAMVKAYAGFPGTEPSGRSRVR